MERREEVIGGEGRGGTSRGGNKKDRTEGKAIKSANIMSKKAPTPNLELQAIK